MSLQIKTDDKVMEGERRSSRGHSPIPSAICNSGQREFGLRLAAGVRHLEIAAHKVVVSHKEIPVLLHSGILEEERRGWRD